MESEMTNSEWRHAALHQYAEAYGEERPDVEYILSPYDTWHRNPFYTGAPGPHPDFDEPYDAEGDGWGDEDIDRMLVSQLDMDVS